MLLCPARRAAAEEPKVVQPATGTTQPAEPIIDIHQHINYSGRSDAQLIEHQTRMGVTQTILLPSGRDIERESTNDGFSNGLQAKAGGNEACIALAKRFPGRYFFFANEVPDLPDTRDVVNRYLKAGALGIGEQKFHIEVDSEPMQLLYDLAADHQVPILMHFQYGMYNLGFERLGDMLAKHPKTTFIGHAQTLWANIDKNHTDPKILYPRTKVTPGGITDRYLTDYPNFFADLSAGSGLNSMLRDEEHARGFLERHQDKILFGSDCNDAIGHGPVCQGYLTIQEVKKLATSKTVERKILFENARKMFKL
jgi:predicted TIM-barrel fold metal-dependent hydrolase